MKNLMNILANESDRSMLMIVSGEDLMEFATALINFAKKEIKEQTEPSFYTRGELAEKLHVSVVTLYRYERDGKLAAPKKINGRLLYDKADVLRMLAKRTKQQSRCI